MRAPRILTPDEVHEISLRRRRALAQERKELDECNATLSELKGKISACKKLNDKAMKYGSQLRLFASFDSYLQARTCLKEYDALFKVSETKCRKFYK